MSVNFYVATADVLFVFEVMFRRWVFTYLVTVHFVNDVLSLRLLSKKLDGILFLCGVTQP